jgi:hypothetical protein
LVSAELADSSSVGWSRTAWEGCCGRCACRRHGIRDGTFPSDNRRG